MTSQPGSQAYAVLQVWLADGRRDEHPILRPQVTLGRSAANDVVLDERSVSGTHCQLRIGRAGTFEVMDLGSLNGTRLNGEPLLPRKPALARPGDIIEVDPFHFRVHLPPPQAPAPPALADRVRVATDQQPCLAIYAQGRLTKQAVTQSPIHIGKAPDNDVVIPVAIVSAHHARLERIGDDWVLHDLDSMNGLVYDGQRIQSRRLGDGDVVSIGQEVALQWRAWTGFLPAGAGAGSPSRTHTVSVSIRDSVTIGRAQDCDLVIDHPQVSRYHAQIERLGTRTRIRDLRSANGVFVDGRRIEGEAWLREGDQVYVGPVKLQMAEGGVQQVAQRGVRLDAMHLKRYVTKSKNLLQDISLSIYPQEFVAVVGLSGAGKSTLMNALNGFRPATQGRVMANGLDLYRNFDMFRSDIGYVPQENIVHTALPVYKALDYAALLRMPADTTPQERYRRITELLRELDLEERKDLAIAKLSGGQLKRVSIGVELLTKPRLFFLDEPTSGLDPGTEYNMMRLLRKLADQGRTIVLVTHATKNVMMCDKVMFMVRGGYVAFFGPPEEALPYFDHHRTEQERRLKTIEFDDIYAILEDESRGSPEHWDRRFRTSAVYKSHIVDRLGALRRERRTPQALRSPPGRRPRVNTLRQWSILTRRYLDLVMRDRLLLFVLLAVMPIVGLLLVLISGSNWLVGDTLEEIDRQLNGWLAQGHNSAWWGVIYNSRTLLLIMGLASVLLGLFSAGFEIVKEWSIYQRERLVIVRILPYLFSKAVVLGVFALLQCALLLLVVSLKVDMPGDGVLLPAPVEMYISLCLGAVTAVLMGLLISALVPNPDTVIYILFVMLFLQIIFAGVIFHIPGVAARISNLTLTRWTMEGLGSTVDMERLDGLTRTRFQGEPISQELSIPVECPGAGTTVITRTVTILPEPLDIPSGVEFQISYERTPAHLFRAWSILAGFGFLFGLGTAIVLRSKDLG